jgi:hypothetical protein
MIFPSKLGSMHPSRWLAVADRWRLPARRWPVPLLLALFLGNAVVAALLNSGTCDELGAHIPSGWLYWKSGVFAGGVGNFPLGQLLLTAPAALLTHDYTLWTEQHLFLFRLPGILLGLGLCFLVWRFARRRHGPGAGLAALSFAALCPNLIAHSTVATLDLPVAFFIFLAVFLLDRCIDRPGLGRMALAAVALAAAGLVKAQALLLYPYALVVLGLLAPRTERGKYFASWLLMPAAWVSLAWIVYRHAPGAGGAFLPPQLLEALRGVLAHAEQGHFAYLLGKYSETGWWYYFPVAILVKTPIAQLLLAGFGLVRRQSRLELLLATAPIVLFLVPAMAGSIDIGLRHILMIYPFLAVAAGRGAVRLWDMGRIHPARETDSGATPARGHGAADASPPRDPAAARILWPRFTLAGLLFTIAGHAAAITPHHLSYFNLLAGGAKNGHRVLIDSNYDWGQNDRFLRSYVETQGLGYRINPYAFWPVNGPILVNANALHGVLNGGPKAYSWLQPFQPVGRVAWTWFEYQVPPGTYAEPREDEEARQQCLAHLFHLREAARLIPGPEFRSLLAQGFAGFGAYDVAFEELRECLQEHPDCGRALILGGELIVRWKLGVLVFHGREYLDGFRTLRPAAEDDEERLVALAQRGGLAANLARFQVRLGMVLESVRDPESARDAYRLAGRLDPADPQAPAALQRLHGRAIIPE